MPDGPAPTGAGFFTPFSGVFFKTHIRITLDGCDQQDWEKNKTGRITAFI